MKLPCHWACSFMSCVSSILEVRFKRLNGFKYNIIGDAMFLMLYHTRGTVSGSMISEGKISIGVRVTID